MPFEFKEKLSPAERKRRAAEYTKWLGDNGFVEDHSKTLLEAQRLLNELQQELAMQGQTNTLTSKLAANIQEQLNTIKL